MTCFINTPKELIPIIKQSINAVETLACDARALHEFLESKQEFSHWIKNRIGKYGFVEGVDFFSFDKIIERETGASVRIEYILSIDMAKQIAMVENNDKGLIVRRYFIECEHIAKEAVHCKIGSYSAHVSETVSGDNQIAIQTFNGQVFTSSLDVAMLFPSNTDRLENCLTSENYFGRDGVTTRNRYSTVNQPRKNVGFIIFAPNRCRNLSNKALPNKTGRSRVRFLVPTPFSIGEKVNTINPLERKLYND